MHQLAKSPPGSYTRLEMNNQNPQFRQLGDTQTAGRRNVAELWCPLSQGMGTTGGGEAAKAAGWGKWGVT